MHNITINNCEKFHYDWLRNENLATTTITTTTTTTFVTIGPLWTRFRVQNLRNSQLNLPLGETVLSMG